MRIGILGATSQIAKDLIFSFAEKTSHELVLYARRPAVAAQWLVQSMLEEKQYAVADFSEFNTGEKFDAILNFVGVGNPAQAALMGATIFDATLQYDEMALNYVRQHSDCRYIFLSSGAAYGSSFDTPADENTQAVIAINNLKPHDWYAVAKLHAECRHRSLPELPIVDIRVFNYFSHTQDIEARFLITDMLRAIRDKTVLKTSSDYIVRDFIHPSDFYQLVNSILISKLQNAVVDCYSKAPVDKPTLLVSMQEKFGLQYEVVQSAGVNATGSKPHYYSLNKYASNFDYQPRFTSVEGVLQGAEKLFKRLYSC